jgi:mRNA-degrading endonuclease toxin of MazEF toxin-antitoxin module
MERRHGHPHLDHGATSRLPPYAGDQRNGDRLLVDQIRSIDTTYIHGDPVYYLDQDELAEVERAVIRYLGLP